MPGKQLLWEALFGLPGMLELPAAAADCLVAVIGDHAWKVKAVLILLVLVLVLEGRTHTINRTVSGPLSIGKPDWKACIWNGGHTK